MIQIMFETFNIAGFYLANPAYLCLCSTGKSAGLVVELGDGISQLLHSLMHVQLLKILSSRN